MHRLGAMKLPHQKLGTLHSCTKCPDVPSSQEAAAGPCGFQRRSNFVGFLISFLPSALIHFIIDFSGLMCQLVSGRACGKVTASQGLRALCSGFYPSNFMQLEPWLPLSWRNVGTILNHRMQACDRKTLVTHLLPVLQAPKALERRDHLFLSCQQ